MHYGIVQQAWENWFVILIMYVFWYGTALWKNKHKQTYTPTARLWHMKPYEPWNIITFTQRCPTLNGILVNSLRPSDAYMRQ